MWISTLVFFRVKNDLNILHKFMKLESEQWAKAVELHSDQCLSLEAKCVINLNCFILSFCIQFPSYHCCLLLAFLTTYLVLVSCNTKQADKMRTDSTPTPTCFGNLPSDIMTTGEAHPLRCVESLAFWPSKLVSTLSKEKPSFCWCWQGRYICSHVVRGDMLCSLKWLAV